MGILCRISNTWKQVWFLKHQKTGQGFLVKTHGHFATVCFQFIMHLDHQF